MTQNFTPLDKSILDRAKPHKHTVHINKVLFGIATITVIIFVITVSVLLDQHAKAQETITLPPVEIPTGSQ